MTDADIEHFVSVLDALLAEYPNEPPHNLAGALLSRVVLIMTADPSTGKDLVKYVWERLDEIETGNPSQFL